MMSLGQQQRTEGPSEEGLARESSRPVVLRLSHVACAYEPGRPAIRDLSLTVREGEILCLLGPSGCGKTTSLRLIAGFEPVTAGEVYLEGRLVSSPGRLVPTEERRVGMVFQEYALFPHLRVAENVAFGLQDLSLRERDSCVEAMLNLLGLSGLERRYPHELSGGQQQRVALARALAPRPSILLLDEPFSNLDPDMTGRMREELHDLLHRTNTTAILVTHDHDEAFSMADRIAVLNVGRLEQFASPETIYHLPASPFVAEFVGQADFITGLVEHGRVMTELGALPSPETYTGGAKVVVMIRPDDLHIVPSDKGPALILSRQFRGSENLYTLRLPSGAVVHSSEPSTSVYPVGTSVGLRLLATHTVLFDQSQIQP